MSSDHKEETQVEVQDFEVQIGDNVDDIEESFEKEGHRDEQTTQHEKQGRKAQAVELMREPGKSLLPFARVQKIIKADKELPVVAKEATFLISLATEEFIKLICQAAHYVAQKEERSTIHYRDLAAVVRRADEFLFLEEVIPWTDSEPPAKRKKPKPSGTASGPTLLDQFAGSTEDNVDQDIVLNADGTMEAYRDFE